MLTLVKNIKELVGVETSPKLRKQGKEMAQLETIKDAYLLIEDGIISKYGAMSEFDTPRPSATPLQEGMVENADVVVDATGKIVCPSFCDSHTHLVYANSREHEFVDKIRGLSYEEIAKRGGGILN